MTEITTCFRHPSLLRKKNAERATGMGVKCVALFAFLL
jgi:hypothetical protein